MKKEIIEGVTFGIMLTGLFVCGMAIGYSEGKREAATDCEVEDECMHIVWNDDDESIPTVGSMVEVQYIDAGCVYIGPKE